MKKVTLSDISKKTGYSINTVSHALRGKKDISEKTIKYITSVAEEMGYIADLSAGALRLGRTKTAAVIVGDISNPHFSIMLKEMEAQLRESGYTTVIFNTDENKELEKNAIITAIGKKVDGIILCPVGKTAGNIELLKSKDIPFVLFGRRFEGESASYVICDDFQSGFEAANHLIELGHKKLLFINAPEYISSARERKSGILSALKKHGLSEKILRTETVDIPEESNIESILSKLGGETGIICFSDIIAMRVCYLLRHMNLSVPGDISVIGFDNIMSKFYFPLGLTSVTASKTKMSVKAVEILLGIIDGSINEHEQIILPTKIIERESTARAAFY